MLLDEPRSLLAHSPIYDAYLAVVAAHLAARLKTSEPKWTRAPGRTSCASPGSGFIVLAATLSAVGNVPVGGLALILGIDRFMSEARAITNFIGQRRGDDRGREVDWRSGSRHARSRTIGLTAPRRSRSGHTPNRSHVSFEAH